MITYDITFGSDSNAVNFALEFAEAADFRAMIPVTDGSVTIRTSTPEQEEVMHDLALAYSGDVQEQLYEGEY